MYAFHGVSNTLLSALVCLGLDLEEANQKLRTLHEENPDPTWLIFQMGAFVRKKIEPVVGHDAAVALSTKLKDEQLAALQAATQEG